MSSRLRLKKMPAGVKGTSGPNKPLGRKKLADQTQEDRERQFRMSFQKLAATWSQPQAEFVFHETRKWRLDFAWPDLKVGVEIQGGIFQRSRTGHSSITGIMRDQEKLNAAQTDGWCVLQFNSKDLDKRPVQVVMECQQALTAAAKRLGKPTPCTGK